MGGEPGLSASGRSREKIGVRQPARPPRFAQVFKSRFL